MAGSEIHENDGADKNVDNGEVKSPEKNHNDSSGESHFKSTYELKENSKYEVNNYSYETDSKGRIKSCEGALKLEDAPRNVDHQVKAGGKDRLETDDGGHLIATRFDGSGKIDNIVPMDSNLNRGEYKKMENSWSKELEKGNNVDVKINCKYQGDSKRPTEIDVVSRTTDSNGNYIDSDARQFKNRSGGR